MEYDRWQYEPRNPTLALMVGNQPALGSRAGAALAAITVQAAIVSLLVVKHHGPRVEVMQPVTVAWLAREPIDLRAPSIAPLLISDTPDVAPPEYAQQAGLQPGTRALVILRVEVRSDGMVGTITVERSGGSEAIDVAAANFVRTLTWIPAHEYGKPVAMTMRFAVQLAA
jgi:TonB family protein